MPEYRHVLQNSPVIGSPGEYKPLIADDHFRLYLYRFWEYQEKLAEFIRVRAEHDPSPVIDTESDGQTIAAMFALKKSFCVISGGPGTGKTTTVAKILALLAQSRKLRIALSAPTGKAAARLQESITREKKHFLPEIQDIIPKTASTLHRLLGTIPGSPYFRYNARRLLPYDVIVIDEASMVDLALMSKLVQAISPKARLILLGDKDQLASVEAGAVLGDICASSINCVVQLEKSYRFGEHSGIGAASRAVNADDTGGQSLLLLKSNKYADAGWVELPAPNALSAALKDRIIHGFQPYLTSLQNPVQALALFEKFRILCALREGAYGVFAINQTVEKILGKERLISGDKRWYAGRPVMITGNDYTLGLFNGDVGIALYEKGGLRVFFQAPDGGIRSFHPLRLPEHETAYSMTVHKSQGSEFERVLLLLPDKDAVILTKELIYTAITRAKESVEIWGKEDIFRAAVSRRIRRSSGLRDQIEKTPG